MSETEVNSQDEKQAPEAASEEKQTVDSVPYARFKELVDEKNTMKAELSAIRNSITDEKESRKIKDLEAKGEYDTVVSGLNSKLEVATKKAEAFDSYNAARRETLLAKLPEDDRAIYEDMNLEKLEVHVDKVSTRPANVPSGRPGRGDYGGYESAVEHALKDPDVYKKSRESHKTSSMWGNLFSES